MADTGRVPSRSGHADLNVQRRETKARKILAVLEPNLPPGNLALLEIGTGSGAMASHFARAAPGRIRVWSVDVEDLRVVSGDYEYTIVEGTGLPFPDKTFDAVVSNHVLEHVGGREDQIHHLAEIERILRPGGVAYLATPNRWAVVEPHFRLPFLSWLPPGISDRYVRMTRRGDRYDCRPVGPVVLSRLMTRSKLTEHHAEIQAAAENAPPRLTRVIRDLGGVVGRFWFLSPTFVMLMRKGTSG